MELIMQSKAIKRDFGSGSGSQTYVEIFLMVDSGSGPVAYQILYVAKRE
jgi:hypothetical protein